MVADLIDKAQSLSNFSKFILFSAWVIIAIGGGYLALWGGKSKRNLNDGKQSAPAYHAKSEQSFGPVLNNAGMVNGPVDQSQSGDNRNVEIKANNGQIFLGGTPTFNTYNTYNFKATSTSVEWVDPLAEVKKQEDGDPPVATKVFTLLKEPGATITLGEKGSSNEATFRLEKIEVREGELVQSIRLLGRGFSGPSISRLPHAAISGDGLVHLPLRKGNTFEKLTKQYDVKLTVIDTDVQSLQIRLEVRDGSKRFETEWKESEQRREQIVRTFEASETPEAKARRRASELDQEFQRRMEERDMLETPTRVDAFSKLNDGELHSRSQEIIARLRVLQIGYEDATRNALEERDWDQKNRRISELFANAMRTFRRDFALDCRLIRKEILRRVPSAMDQTPFGYRTAEELFDDPVNMLGVAEIANALEKLDSTLEPPN